MGDIATDGSKMHDSAQNVLAKRLQPPRVTFFVLDVEFQRKAEFYAIVEKVRSGELDPVVAKLLPLSQAVEAHEMLISGAAIKGKMLFVVDQELATKYGV
jgi:NADPH:quinone reductase-like Zn-dependent oxidoreductase